MVLKLENLLETGHQHQLNFQISEKMVKAFSELTDDRNSLHVDAAFGRRSIYRKNVAHGLLGVAHLLLLDLFHANNLRFSIKKISASFLKPVFLNEALSLNVQIKKRQEQEDRVELEFTIKNTKSDVVVTKGSLLLGYLIGEKEVEPRDDRRISQAKMVMAPLRENDLVFDEIPKDRQETIPFKISKDCAHALFSLLGNDRSTDSGRSVDDIDAGFPVILLFSTFAGMCIPGRYATIINFEMTFEKHIQWDEPYDFTGRVVFKSSLNSLSEEIMIKSKSETVYARGKMNVQVNPPPVKMSSIDALRESGLDLQLKDKVVLITGASRGIGETTAKLFALYGAKVVINYFQGKEDAERIVKEIADSGHGEAMAVGADVSDPDQVSAMAKAVCARFNTIDVLVNNAVGNAMESNFMALSWDDVQKDIDIIVRGAFNCCKAVIPYMIKSRKGSIINVSTVYADNPPRHQFKYVVAKSGLVGLTRSLAVDLAPNNISVNMVVPGIVETDLTAGINKMAFNGIVQNMPMKRIASPVDVARAIIFLASSLNSFTTGQKLMVTGGIAPFL